MAARTKKDELDVLFPDVEFHSAMGTFTASPYKFGDWKEVLAILKRYSDVLDGSENFVGALLERGDEALDDLARLAQLSTGIELEDLGKLPGNEAIDLFFLVAEVNADFFVQKIRAGADRFSRRISNGSMAGEKSLPASLVQGTAG